MSLIYWIDCAAYAISAAIALALTLVVLGTGPRRTLNRLFALFVLAEACWAVSALLTRTTLWLKTGNPARILELSVLSFALIGPTLLMFTVRYVGRPPRWANRAAALGLAATAALAIPLFRHQIVSNLRLAADLIQPYYDVSRWGFVLSALPAGYMIASLVLFWRNRHRTQELHLAAGVLIMLAGFIGGGLLQPRFPVMSFTTTISVAILGHAIIGRQILNPLRDLSAELEQKVEARTCELEAERSFVSTVLNTAGALVVVLDAQGHIVRFNRACEQVTGYTFDEVQGRHLWDILLNPEDAASVRAAFDPSPQSEFLRERESYWLARDGRRRLIAWSNSVILDDEGAVDYVIHTGIDITERKQAEERLHRSLEEAARNQRLLLALSRAAQAIQRAHTPKQVYRSIGDEIVKLGLHTTVFTLSENQTHLVAAHMTLESAPVSAAETLAGLSAQGYRFPLEPGGFYARVIAQGETLFSDAGAESIAEALPRPVRPLAGRLVAMLGLNRVIYAPLTIGEEPHGLMTVMGAGLTEANVPAVSAFASQVTIAIENARLYQSARQEIAERKRTEASLRESEQRYRSLFEDSPISLWEEDFSDAMVFLHNLQGSGVDDLKAYLTHHPQAVAHCGTLVKVVDVNKATLKMYKAASKEEFRNGLGTVFGEESYHTFVDELAALAEGKTRIGTETTNCTLTGELKHIALTLQVAPGHEDTLSKVLISIVDMTERKRAEKALERRAAQLALLSDVGGQIAAVLDLDSLLDRTARLVQQSFGYHHVGLFTLDRQRDELVLRARAGDFAHRFSPDHRLKVGQGLVGWVGRHGERRLVNDVDAESQYVNLYPDTVPTRAELSVPIKIGDQVVGVLDVQSPQLNAFGAEDVAVLEALADQIAVAIENARLYDAMQQELAERKRTEEALRESRERLRTIVEGTQAFLVNVDARGHFTYVNDAAARYLGYERPEKLIGEQYLRFVHPEDRDWVHHTYIDQVNTGQKSQALEFRVIDTENQVKYFSFLSTPVVEDGQVVGQTSVGQDITARKRAQEQLQRYAAELEQSNEEIKQFAYIVSHDLRAPLVNLKGFAAELRAALAVVGSSLIETLPHLDEKQQRSVTLALQEDVPEALEFIDAAVSHMDAFINAVLKLSRLGHRELKLEPLHTEALVQASLQTLAHQLKGCQVTVSALPDLIADRTSMEQVWGNLLGNAVKYLDPNRPGVIEITAQRADVASGDDEATFHVRDNGRGIAPEDMHKVFAPFRRAGTQDVPGEGMGLAYVQTLLRRHGGRIWCESEPAVGTTFSFTIPNQPTKGMNDV